MLALTARVAVVVGDDVLARAAGERIRSAPPRSVSSPSPPFSVAGHRRGFAEGGAVAAELEVVCAGAAGDDQALDGGPRDVGCRVAVEIGAEGAAEDDVVVVRQAHVDRVGAAREVDVEWRRDRLIPGR